MKRTINPMTGTELENWTDEEYGKNWGPWKLNPSGRYILAHGYSINLDECYTSAQVLDWICQIAGKGWGVPGVVSGLVHTLDAILHPQSRLCSWGESKEIDRATVTVCIAAAVAHPNTPIV